MVALGADWLHVDVMVRRCLPLPAAATTTGAPPTFVSVQLGMCHPANTGLRISPALLQDGHFVPNLTLGAPIVKSLRKHTAAFLDVHLMVTNPAQVCGWPSVLDGLGCEAWGLLEGCTAAGGLAERRELQAAAASSKAGALQAAGGASLLVLAAGPST